MQEDWKSDLVSALSTHSYYTMVITMTLCIGKLELQNWKLHFRLFCKYIFEDVYFHYLYKSFNF